MAVDAEVLQQTDRMADRLGRDVLIELLSHDELKLVVYNREGSTVYPLQPERVLIIGRERPSDLVLPERSLSRQHARLTTSATGVWIEDLESTNGTLVNGVRVQRAHLRLGDQITLGGTLLALQAVSATGPRLRPIDSHDRFAARLDEELTRSRIFRHSCALLMVRGQHARGRHVAQWRAAIEGLLRPVDHLGLYAADTLEILAPELDARGAEKLAAAIGLADRDLRCGLAVYPEDGGTSDALITSSRARCQGEAGLEPATVAVRAPVLASAKMVATYAEVERVARTELPVLILGETGSGKELIAQHLHARSSRHAGPMCAINCAAIPESLMESVLFGHEKGSFTGAATRRVGLLESAAGGTVFLDEIGELPLPAQAALLRALDTKRIRRVGANEEIPLDIRVVAATHRDLEKRRLEGSFREDLLYRLNTITIRVPPLRDRRDDIGPLTLALVEAAAKAMRCEPPRVTQEAMALLTAHAWPGNVRELKNALERAVAICQNGQLTPDDLPEVVRRQVRADSPQAEAPTLSFAEAVRQFEAELIVDALRACDWNQSRAAERLALPRRTLVHKIKAYGIRRLGYAVEAGDDET